MLSKTFIIFILFSYFRRVSKDFQIQHKLFEDTAETVFHLQIMCFITLSRTNLLRLKQIEILKLNSEINKTTDSPAS